MAIKPLSLVHLRLPKLYYTQFVSCREKKVRKTNTYMSRRNCRCLSNSCSQAGWSFFKGPWGQHWWPAMCEADGSMLTRPIIPSSLFCIIACVHVNMLAWLKLKFKNWTETPRSCDRKSNNSCVYTDQSAWLDWNLMLRVSITRSDPEVNQLKQKQERQRKRMLWNSFTNRNCLIYASVGFCDKKINKKWVNTLCLARNSIYTLTTTDWFGNSSTIVCM